MTADAKIAGWAYLMGSPRPESVRSRRLAHVGGVSAASALILYVSWRIAFTLPAGGWNLAAACVLIGFEAVPIVGLFIRIVTLWNIDCHGPEPVLRTRPGNRVAVMIPTYNEPAEVIAPTIAAACALEPAHQTWVLDDGDREWVADMCATYGARYVRRDRHDHAKAGNMNNALDLMASEAAAGAEEIDILAVLDCDHVPMREFLSATLGWFDDPKVALVQGPQNYYNAGAFDDDGETGEQGVFFHVLMPGRNHDSAGPFWCGSTSLIRAKALREIGGISTETIVEDMHTTLGLIRAGWKTVFHHQTLAVGLGPSTPDQYLLQRRRWGMGSMQVLVKERLWAAKRWLSWRNFYEYLTGTIWWLEGVGTALAFVVPAVMLVTGVQTSTASPIVFAMVFAAMFAIRLWGASRLYRGHLHWPTAFALRVLRIPVGISCLWWLITRRDLQFQVTPKAGADERVRGRMPGVVWALFAIIVLVLLYAVAGTVGLVPWYSSPSSTIASGVWLVMACLALIISIRRVRAAAYATSRRNAHRVPVRAAVTVNGTDGTLLDISIGGAAVRFPAASLNGAETVELTLPGARPIRMETVRVRSGSDGYEIASLRVATQDWEAYRTMSLWLFHTPPGVVAGLPSDAPAVAAVRPPRRPHRNVLERQHG